MLQTYLTIAAEPETWVQLSRLITKLHLDISRSFAVYVDVGLAIEMSVEKLAVLHGIG